MKNIIVKINDAVQTVQEVAVVTNDGQPTVIKGVKNVNYQLVDQATGRGPDHIVTKRVGKDLHISLEDAGEETDLIIEGFYEDDRSALIGQAEDGQYYYYIPDTGEVADYVTQLQAGDVEGQALGGSPYATPWWIGATDTGFGYLPWILGLIGVGALAAALADDDDDKSSTTTADPGSITVDAITTDSYQANIPPWLIDESQKTDFITNDQTLVFSGTLTKELAADEKVQISLDGGTTWVDAVTTGTSWSYDNTTNTMAEGTYDVIARIVDTIGNVGPSATQEVVIDITPSNLTVTNVSIVADTSDDGILTADEVGTATTTDVTVTFTNAVEGDVIYLTNNINDDPSTYMVHTLTAEEAAAGTYTFTGVDLPVGADSSLISLAQSGRDQAGNVSSSNQVTDEVRIPSTPTISLGANDDSLTAGDIIRGSTIDMGDGNDTVDFTAATFGQAAYTTSLSTGAGEDVIKLGTLTTSLTGSHSVDAGADNDTVVLTQDYTRESIGMTTYIQGGEGTDTLAITGDGTTVRISSGTYLGVNEGIVGFENFDMTVNSALEAETTAQTVSLTAADVLSLGVTDNTIYISGDANDTVDLGANGSTNTGSFTKTLTTTTQTALDGTEHTYTLYTHTNGAQVYIDNNIVNASGVI
ncbi:Ig-like domain-containing protein [Moraxella porci]|uniref:Ig-like domain-containing protein n=1 Tax=Moraxella porci TaxID=1288392 RepID=UPI00244A6286|nr:Ig-like domain-containing protein [Moraxella porci]MDH2273604.1 Ig-like domain-containing protein [Moraxella porci]